VPFFETVPFLFHVSTSYVVDVFKLSPRRNTRRFRKKHAIECPKDPFGEVPARLDASYKAGRDVFENAKSFPEGIPLGRVS